VILFVQQTKWGIGRHILTFLDHTKSDRQTHTYPVGPLWTSDQLVAKAATNTTHNRRTFMHSAGFEPAIAAIDWPQSSPLGHATTGIGNE
jgi:hypothetical protein